MEFEKQIRDVELVIDTTPRFYIKWENTEEGRDKKNCYERVVHGETVVYINNFNRNLSVTCGNPFWNVLEKIYNDKKAETKYSEEYDLSNNNSPLLDELAEIKSGIHKQFVYDSEKQRVECRCGQAAIWWRTGYLCGTITAYPCKFN